MMSDEIMTCPCCSSYPELIQIGNDHTKKRYVEIKCKSCMLRMKKGAIRNSMDWLKNITIESWNKRLNK
jgi:hypothetical protein